MGGQRTTKYSRGGGRHASGRTMQRARDVRQAVNAVDAEARGKRWGYGRRGRGGRQAGGRAEAEEESVLWGRGREEDNDSVWAASNEGG